MEREFVWTDNRNTGVVVWYDEPSKFPEGKFLEVTAEDLYTARKQAEELWTI